MSDKDEKRPPRVNKLAARLLGQTANLERNVSEHPPTPIASQRNVTMPGQLGAFRLEAQKYQAKIDELQQQLTEAGARAAAGGTDVESAALREELEQLQAASRAEIEALKASLDEAARNVGKPFDAPMNRIRKIPGRQRYLTPDEKAALYANLDNNKMLTPVTLRPTPDGWFDMVSGHNRYDYHEDRGRPTISSVLDMSEDAHGDRDAFYANLLHNSLTDYAKYVGFKKLLLEDPAATIADVAKHAGVPRSTVANLMVFGELPKEALALLDAHQDKLGRSAAAELAALHGKGHTASVMEAIRAVVAGTASQSDAVATAKRALRPAAPPRPPAEPTTVRSGRATYCKAQHAKKVLRLEFNSEVDAELALPEVLAALQRLAEGKK
ncbi:hypothetical protein LPN04_29080 [Rugamonas sp. A1-17]|nr:hypothetical protein [Rugamonas sp. A1-17]